MLTAGAFTSVGPVDSDGGWQETVSRLHGAMKVKTDGVRPVYSGHLRWIMTDNFRVVAWSGESERLTRGPRELRFDPQPMFEIISPLSGGVVLEQGSTRFTVRPGEIAIADLDGPLACEHRERTDALCLLVPQESALARLPKRLAPGPIEARRGMGFVARETMRAISGQAEGLGARGFDAACERLLDLTILALAGADGGAADEFTETETAIRRHVRANLGDPQLSGQSIADAIGWSLRHVQGVLQRSGTTPSDLIRNERLAVARMLLADPRNSHLSIGGIALRCGFVSHTVFARAFRRHFGLSPQDVRGGRARPV